MINHNWARNELRQGINILPQGKWRCQKFLAGHVLTAEQYWVKIKDCAQNAPETDGWNHIAKNAIGCATEVDFFGL
jgi:hypothetical protein